MKKYIGIISFFLLLISISGCEETKLEEAKEYDFGQIEPKIYERAVNPGTPVMVGRTYDYSLNYRTNSTYEWNFASSTAEVIQHEDYPSMWYVHVYFGAPVTSADSTFTVTETTEGGKTSNTYTGTIPTGQVPFEARAIEGTDVVNAGFNTEYAVAYSPNDTLFSTWEWKSDNGDVTVEEGRTWKATFKFAQEDVGPVDIYAIETNSHGLTDTAKYSIEVFEYCPLDAISDLVGTYAGQDGYAPAAQYGHSLMSNRVTTKEFTSEKMEIIGLNFDWMETIWGETITDSAYVKMYVNQDGTVEIPQQDYIKTIYDGDPYEYQIKGAGRWNNCGNNPTLTIEYDVYNVTDDYWTAVFYYIDYLGFEKDKFTATLTMNPNKSSVKVNNRSYKKLKFPPDKRR